MTTRQAACDPCRRAKLACDHKRPTCTRCEQSEKTRLCAYRASPFKRKRSDAPAPAVRDTSPNAALSNTLLTNISPQKTSYPNSGFLGSSSHVAIFGQIPSQNRGIDTENEVRNASSLIQSEASGMPLSAAATEIAGLLHQLLDIFDLSAMRSLVDFWLTKGTNLALAQPYVQACVESMKALSVRISQDPGWHTRLTSDLSRKSTCPLDFHQFSIESDFVQQFSGPDLRWETLGIFFSAVIRATYDVPLFPQLYTTEFDKQKLRACLMKLTDHVLELCLSLDNLNDLKLVFQYENCIVHSYVDGDYNLNYWRRLGDVIGSLFALGYHEDNHSKTNTPDFLIQLRKTAFARIYSADKNVAIFLGRPPRMSKRFCFFQIPGERRSASTQGDVQSLPQHASVYDWPLDLEMNLTSETRWTAICAFFKEEILEMLPNRKHENHEQRADDMKKQIKACWQALPSHFRLQGSLKQYSDRTPFERDFLASTRLNYLHVRFLLQFVLLTLLAEPNDAIVEIAQEILSLTVEIILLRDHIVNSGTGLTWKIAHYGLPAAGIVLLASLNQQKSSNVTMTPLTSRVWQDLNVLVAEVQMGAIVQASEPNYVLLSRATQTIQDFLQSLTFVKVGATNSGASTEQQGDTVVDSTDHWTNSYNPDPWDLEIEFWRNLAEHPFIAGEDVGV